MRTRRIRRDQKAITHDFLTTPLTPASIIGLAYATIEVYTRHCTKKRRSASLQSALSLKAAESSPATSANTCVQDPTR
ncbi:MAG: hypothetical protein HC945_00245 [Nitrosarchaeum sp.]|nr:hypothetical protein [Nitrosarchaeum sp.]